MIEYNYLDFLLFNVKFNCYVVIELKVTEIKAEYIGQVIKYVNYVDKNIKEVYNEPTVGVIICKKETNTLWNTVLTLIFLYLLIKLYKDYFLLKMYRASELKLIIIIVNKNIGFNSQIVN